MNSVISLLSNLTAYLHSTHKVATKGQSLHVCTRSHLFPLIHDFAPSCNYPFSLPLSYFLFPPLPSYSTIINSLVFGSYPSIYKHIVLSFTKKTTNLFLDSYSLSISYPHFSASVHNKTHQKGCLYLLYFLTSHWSISYHLNKRALIKVTTVPALAKVSCQFWVLAMYYFTALLHLS